MAGTVSLYWQCRHLEMIRADGRGSGRRAIGSRGKRGTLKTGHGALSPAPAGRRRPLRSWLTTPGSNGSNSNCA